MDGTPPRRVLVTGASGFVGAALTRDLAAAGHEVHVIVRAPATAWRLAGVHGLVFHTADLRDAAGVRVAVRGARPDIVFHAAAHGTMPGQRERAAILDSNLTGTANLLDALDDHPYDRLVNLGSSSEYGHVDRPMAEDDQPRPRGDYGVAKAAATLLCQAEAYKGRPVCTVRIFSAYGPWEDSTRIASAVITSCLNGIPPRVTAGAQPRDFVYVDDVVALLKAAASHPAAVGEILHAGTGRRQTVRDIVEAAVRACGGPSAVYGSVPPRADEPTTWVASIDRTRRLTGWEPRVSLDDGVRRLRDWLADRLARAAA